MRDAYRLPIWVAALCAAVALESIIGRPVRDASAGAVLAELVTFAVMTPFLSEPRPPAAAGLPRRFRHTVPVRPRPPEEG